jgi:hypothetical protein
MPDILVGTLFRDNQAKLGMPDIDELLAERDVLVSALADKKVRNKALAAKFAYTTSMWDAERTVRKSLALLKVRDAAENEGKKYTDKVLDALAHADADYRKWLTDSFVERAQYLSAEAEYARDEERIDAITERIRRANITGRSFAFEP